MGGAVHPAGGRRRLEIWFFAVLAAVHGLLAAACLPFVIARFGVWYFGFMAVCCLTQALLLRAGDRSRAARWLARVGRVLFWLWAALFALAQGMIVLGQQGDEAAEQAQVILVLGAGLKDDAPSAALRARLDVAAAFLQRHPDALAVLCGGLGEGQHLTEAEAMRRYLVDRGVAPERLLKEDRSTDTRENILFARRLLEEQGLGGAATAVITNEFHLCRARRLMEWAGLDGVGLSAATPVAPYRALMRIRETFPLLWLLSQGG